MIIHSNQDTRSFGTPLLICQVISINATVLHDNGQAVLIWSNLYVNSAVLLQWTLKLLEIFPEGQIQQ